MTNCHRLKNVENVTISVDIMRIIEYNVGENKKKRSFDNENGKNQCMH